MSVKYELFNLSAVQNVPELMIKIAVYIWYCFTDGVFLFKVVD